MTNTRSALFHSSAVFLVLALVACQRQEGPKPEAPPAQAAKPAIIATRAEKGSPWTMALEMQPAQPRSLQDTRFRVTITDATGKPVGGAAATASLVMPLMDMGKNEFPLAAKDGGVYEGAGKFTMDTEWEVRVTAVAGKKQGTNVFNVMVAE